MKFYRYLLEFVNRRENKRKNKIRIREKKSNFAFPDLHFDVGLWKFTAETNGFENNIGNQIRFIKKHETQTCVYFISVLKTLKLSTKR